MTEQQKQVPRVLFLPGMMGTSDVKRDTLIQTGFNVNAMKFDDNVSANWQDLLKHPIRHFLSLARLLTKARRLYTKWVEDAQAACDSFQPDIIVGASRGGSVAMTMRVADNVPILLLAPAYKWFSWIGGRASTTHPNVTVIHSRMDESIPFTDSVELCRKCPQVKLIEAGSDHYLNTPNATQVWLKAIRDLTTP